MRSRRGALTVLLAVLSAAAAGIVAGGPAAGAERDDDADKRPNVVVVMTDDQELDSMRFMPKTRALIAGRGVNFPEAFVSFPLCCPSRATFLTGQYAHNHGVMNNTPPEGGFEALDGSETLPVWLKRAGYQTALVCKYLNGYEQTDVGVPEGWTEWHGSKRTNWYYGMQLLEGGRRVEYGSGSENPDDPARPGTYSTDVCAAIAADVIRRQAPERKPFFLWLNPIAPHEGDPNPEDSRCHDSAKPAKRHLGSLSSQPLPMPPSFNEADVSDKPLSIQARDRFTAEEVAEITTNYRCRIESLRAVDDGIETVVSVLRQARELRNTLLIFTSDNGFLLGEHRLSAGKDRPYEEAIRVPLMMRGPGIPKGKKVREMTVNTDLTATILDFADAKAKLPQEGVSLLRLIRDPRRRRGREFPIEGLHYTGIRTERYLYVRYEGGIDDGAVEMYDLKRDPHELRSVHSDPAYARARAQLERSLQRLRDCRGRKCL